MSTTTPGDALDFTPEIAIKAAGAGGRLYMITPIRKAAESGKTPTYDVTVLQVIEARGLHPSGRELTHAKTLDEAMTACMNHETSARKATARVGLVFKPYVFFHARGAHGRRYTIDYDAGTFVESTSYEYPAWVDEDMTSTPLGTWATLKDAMEGCNENEAAATAREREDATTGED